MMNTPKQEKILKAIGGAFVSFNDQLSVDRRLNTSLDCKIVGSPNLDSAEIVNLLVTVEQQIEQEFGVAVTLFENIESFVNVQSLVTFLEERL